MRPGFLLLISVSFIFLVVAVTPGPVQAQNGTKITGKVDLKGGYRTTKKEPAPGVVPNEYNKTRTTVTAHYDIAVKTDPKSGKKVFDLENSKVIFENEFKVNGKNFKTDPVPITKVEGDPETGKIKSFDAKGKKWDPARAEESDGIEGHIELPKDKVPAKGWVRSRYKLKSGSKYGYTFNTVSKPPAKPKEKKGATSSKPEVKVSRTTVGSEMSYDPTTDTLSLGLHTVTNTLDPFDPILGGELTFDSYDFTGLTSAGDLAIFWSLGGGLLNVGQGGELFERAELPVLYYSVAQDLFFGGLFGTRFAGMLESSPFYDPALAEIGSPYFDTIAGFLDPVSPNFDPLAFHYMTFTPDTNFFDLTDGFAQAGQTVATGQQFAAVPEPVSLLMLVTGLVVLATMVRHRHGAPTALIYPKMCRARLGLNHHAS